MLGRCLDLKGMESIQELAFDVFGTHQTRGSPGAPVTRVVDHHDVELNVPVHAPPFVFADWPRFGCEAASNADLSADAVQGAKFEQRLLVRYQPQMASTWFSKKSRNLHLGPRIFVHKLSDQEPILELKNKVTARLF